MPESQKKKLKRWIQSWEKTGSVLDKIKLNELRASDYYSRNQVLLNDMLQYACEHCEPRLSSGLVEQQKFFTKFRKQMSEIDE